MNSIRPILHDVLNALAIARGLTEGVQASLRNEIVMSDEQKIDKLERSIKSLDKLELLINEIRSLVIKEE